MSLRRFLRSSYSLLGSTHRIPSTNPSRSFHVSNPRSVLYENANRDTFTETTSKKDRITVVDFYADWCGPCRTLSPVLEKLTTDPNLKTKEGLPFDLVKIDVDTDDGQELGTEFKVAGIPTVVAFRASSPVGQFTGAIPQSSLKQFLENLK